MAKLDLTKLAGGAKPTPAPETQATTGGTQASAENVKPAGLGFLKNRIGATTPKPEEKVVAETKAGLGFLKQQQAVTETPAPPKEAEVTSSGPDLDSLLNHEDGGAAPAPARLSRFADEEPAIAPNRDLEGLEKQQLMFVESLDSVYKIIHDPELLGGIIKNIMMELAQKPEYRKLIQPKDIHTMIKGMRESMGMARIKKEESKAKRGGGRKTTKKVDDLDTLAALDEAFAGVEL